eukprot:TRINITY_DN4066_c0_g1_i1.p1 TRINITY_DN4066_c0_g1~~TRINITY_DN4066_c0_g1_i1.p1  ORF type:complete len:241 (-),score=60.26 TRINITY_DN4066_c0_g1_i1:49-771(-)
MLLTAMSTPPSSPFRNVTAGLSPITRPPAASPYLYTPSSPTHQPSPFNPTHHHQITNTLTPVVHFNPTTPTRSLSPPASPTRRSQFKSKGATTTDALKETLKRKCLAKMKQNRNDMVDRARGGSEQATSPFRNNNEMRSFIRDEWFGMRNVSKSLLAATEELDGDDYFEIMQFLEEELRKDLQNDGSDASVLFEESHNFDQEALEYLATQYVDAEEEFSQEMLDAIDEVEQQATMRMASQ